LYGPAFLHPIGKTVFKIINGGCLRVYFNFVSILSFCFDFNKEKCRKYYEKKREEDRKARMPKTGNVTAVIPKHPRL
jgi:hypothetical protein